MIKDLCEDEWIKEIYNKVEEFEKNNNAWAHHEMEHVLRVSHIAETLLKQLKYDNNIIESTKIACILHDIGCIEGKENHAFRSYRMAKEYFNRKNMKLKNENEILEAIKEHSDGFESDNIITLTLVIADKLDIDKRRIALAGYYVIGMRQLQYINKITFEIKNKLLAINFMVNDNFNSRELENFYFMKKVVKSVHAF